MEPLGVRREHAWYSDAGWAYPQADRRLSGEFYRQTVAAHEDDPGEAGWWAQLASIDWRSPHAAPPDPTSAGSPISSRNEALGRIAYGVRRFLTPRKIAVDPGDSSRIAQEVGRSP
jgi:hypothetical protein